MQLFYPNNQIENDARVSMELLLLNNFSSRTTEYGCKENIFIFFPIRFGHDRSAGHDWSLKSVDCIVIFNRPRLGEKKKKKIL